MYSQKITNMRAHITATPQDLHAIDYTHAKITNLYIVNIDDCSEIINKPVSFAVLRKYVLQSLYTPDLLKGNFGLSLKFKGGSNWKPVEFVGYTDGTDQNLTDKYDGVSLTVYMYGKDANAIMRDVFRALSMNDSTSVSINITLKDGRKVTINENFPNTQRTLGWKSDYVEFANKFVMN